MSLAGIARILGFDREPCWKCMCRCSQRVKKADYTHRQNVSFSQFEWMLQVPCYLGYDWVDVQFSEIAQLVL